MPIWIKFRLTERPYRDINGNVLKSLDGIRNRKGIDEVTGGGKDGYPQIGKHEIIEQYEFQGHVLVRSTISVEKAVQLGGQILSETEGNETKATIFSISGSGVTR
jgi:hypothetical protein